MTWNSTLTTIHPTNNGWANPRLLFRMPEMDLYDGISNPLDHLERYKTLMMIWVTNALFCLAFLATLWKAAPSMVLETSPKKHWLLRTTRATISGTLQYQQGVATNFGSLFSMKQRKGKALKDYLVRFNAATLKIYDLNQDVAMMIVIQGLHSSWFTYSQNKMTPRSYSKLLAWT